MEMLATTIGLPDDLSLTWDQREEQWKLSGKIYKTNNFTQSAEGHKDVDGSLRSRILGRLVFVCLLLMDRMKTVLLL